MSTPPARVVHSRPKQEWAEEERAVAAQYAIHLFRPRNGRQEEKNRTAEQSAPRVYRLNRGPPTAESPRPVVKAGNAARMKGDPYVKKTPQITQARRQVSRSSFHLEHLFQRLEYMQRHFLVEDAGEVGYACKWDVLHGLLDKAWWKVN